VEATGLARTEINQMKVNEAVTLPKLENEVQASGLRGMPRTTGLTGTMVVVLKWRFCKK